MGDFSEKTQFDYLYDVLASKYPGIKNADGKNTMFQFLITPMAANWSKSNLVEGYDLVNTVPANLDGFWVESSSKVDQGCKNLYRAIKPVASVDMKTYIGYQSKYQALNNQLADMNAQAVSDYQVWKVTNTDDQGIAPNISVWYQDPHGGRSWSNKMANLQQQLDSIASVMQILVDNANSPAKDAQKAFYTDIMTIAYPGSPKPLYVPRVTIDGSLSEDLVRWQNMSEGAYDFDVRINRDQTITSPWKTTYDTKITQNCYKTSADVKVKTSRIITDAHYELRYTAVGLQSYQITRGDWFDGSLVRPDVTLIDGIAATSDTFFGANGCLHLIPVNILVMYKPTVQLTISAERYQQELGAYADLKIDWLEIFGFRFSAGATSKLEPVTNPDGTITVEFASPANPVPQIVGITSQVLYNYH